MSLNTTGDKLVEITNPNGSLSMQAFDTKHGKVLLAINKRNRTEQLRLPPEADGAAVSFVAPSTGNHEAVQEMLRALVAALRGGR